jgi:hypothetical protein
VTLRKFIVLTPTRNEAWCLETFISATTLWADYIIIRDQNSIDGSREIAAKFPNVLVLDNPSKYYNESENRRQLLFEARRRFGLGNVLFSLDADERLSPEILKSELLATLRGLEPGTGIKIPFANVRPGLGHFWSVEIDPIAWVDDGREPETTSNIHFPRTTIENFAKVFEPRPLKIIHLQYIYESQFREKQVWYILKEVLDLENRNIVKIFRRYMHVLNTNESKSQLIPSSWWSDYASNGVNIFETSGVPHSWRSIQIEEYFRRIDPKTINKLPRRYFGEYQELRRGHWLVHTYLERTQRFLNANVLSPANYLVRFVDLLLSRMWRVPRRSSLDLKKRTETQPKKSTNS